jgi:chromosomal replication initiator protein
MDIKEIIEAVARHYNTSVSGILSPIRDDKIINARHVAIYLVSSCTTASLIEIGKAFNRTHATVYFAERKVFERMAEDDVFRSEVEQLQWQLEPAERPKTAVSMPAR